MPNLSKNVSSAGNWQERLDMAWWIVGFVDGEGTFAVNLFRNNTSKLGWQCFPEFVITQSYKSIDSLLSVKEFFACGQIYINKRYDNHREDLVKYCVRSRIDLTQKIIPFFDNYHLRTSKSDDFKRFSKIVRMMDQKHHLTKEGLVKIAKIIETMNFSKRSAYLESSEAIR